jgi:hypothetical protein
VLAVNLVAAAWVGYALLGALLAASGCEPEYSDAGGCVKGVGYWAAIVQAVPAVAGAFVMLVITSPRRRGTRHRGIPTDRRGQAVVVGVLFCVWLAAVLLANLTLD